ncbi:sodium-dependent transporter [Crassaminicella profunda]|uniref:sodium-dependent transporter n=1 Tax=Crassaminicella profunda TaxID=1286698 RepID=UPI001CA64443|nr:sodium-dependent transporter [Crassaminicella profunda]QZY57208.1 sodium-dependent transporter [Crassaminicella profunda]
MSLVTAKNEKNKRDKWGSKIGFVLAAAGSAVGLGNLWKFPYSVGNNGGGAFVMIYMIFLILIGLPLMLAAITLGRKTQLSAVGAYRSLKKNWAFVGGLGVLCGFFILAFYSTVGGWVIYYCIKAFTGGLAIKDPEVLGGIFGGFISSPASSIMYQGIFLILTLLIVIRGISSGIEKASKIMMPALFGMIILIAIRSVTLPGASAGIEFFLVPDFSKINMDVVMNALGQVFFSLSIGMGVMVTYGSYLDKDTNLLGPAASIPVLDTMVAILAGFATLPAVFAIGFKASSGPGLMFVTLPAVFASMPFGKLFCILFFVLVLFAALTSSISMLEVCVSYFVDEKGANRTKAAMMIIVIMYIVGIPAALSMGPWKDLHILGNLNFFDFYDKLTSNILLTSGGLLLSIFVGWIWGADNAIEEIEKMGVKFTLAPLWKFLIKYIVPPAVFIILINSFKSVIAAIF